MRIMVGGDVIHGTISAFGVLSHQMAPESD